MRFNNHELAILAKQESSRFEKEGCLFMKLKQDKLFKKGEGEYRYLSYHGSKITDTWGYCLNFFQKLILVLFFFSKLTIIFFVIFLSFSAIVVTVQN